MTEHAIGLIIFPGLYVVIAITFFAIWCGYRLGRRDTQEDAVQARLAHYDPKTREFKWGKMG